MAKTKISDDHMAAAQAQVEALARAGFKATVREVLLGSFVSNAIESTITLAHVGSEESPARPELDTAAARRLFVDPGEDAWAQARVVMSCVAVARGLLRARKSALSLERQGHHIGQALVEMFAAMAETDLVQARADKLLIDSNTVKPGEVMQQRFVDGDAELAPSGPDIAL